MKVLLAGAVAAAAVVCAPVAHADYVFDVCPSGRSGIATGNTSCPFADVVRATYMSDPATFIQAYSPVTGSLYAMYCDTGQVLHLNIGSRLGVRCSGGFNAVVVFW